MTYQYENLGDERFQQLAQAILTTVFPNVQCLPVGQPDGGRDAFWYTPRKRKSKTIIFQVKYAKNPDARDERDAVAAAIKSEKDKVAELIKRGASSYYLITNTRGTSHPDVGSIDTVNRELSDAFGIPSYCWWRDDIDRRIDANADIKWSYPDIVRGSDVLQWLVAGTWKADANKRDMALRSYIATQHKDDEEVKFKQVELQNRLLDLFVDLPVLPLDSKNDRQKMRYIQGSLDLSGTVLIDDAMLMARNRDWHFHRRHFPDTAEFLLQDGNGLNAPCIVLEGAPGQGKSTITQYVCQVHRLKLLGQAHELIHAPKSHVNASVRIPFRIDLRDYAAWLSGRNPFAPDGQNSEIRSSTLESFIAAQVSQLSGGQDFSAADLTAVAKSGRILIVLDGFDEVADIPTRQKVVDEITRAASRIRAHQQHAQIVVTSRPAAFANSPGFPHTDWLHLEIQSMTPEQIAEYARKWMAARHLPPRERKEFLSLLKEKLEQPHMRDLSRNPMQLTILLALIHTRGLSLPDKRTSLYDNYMELFFNRESEKSRVVREHRDLLLDIHRYLAWTLHTTAEEKGSGGIIAEGDLKDLLRQYLRDEGHDTQLVQELFTGMVERVVALVSRVQGTFEFEVQPLREYFAARHLYETAPYSPPGDERSGTKPERFDALSRNFYWLNVVRFYCGCFSRGELSSLVDGLDDLSQDDDYRLLAHPRTLAFMLLGDWVFTQQPILVSRVVKLNLAYPGLKILLSSTYRSPNADIVLPERCGKGDLVKGAYQLLSDHNLSREDRTAILQMIKLNADPAQSLSWWLESEPSGSSYDWLADGLALGTLANMPVADLAELASRHLRSAGSILREAGRYDVIYSDQRIFRQVLNDSVSGVLSIRLMPGQHDPMNSLEAAINLLAPFLSRMLLNNKDGNTAAEVVRVNGITTHATKEPVEADFDELQKAKEFVAEASALLQSETLQWASSLEPWQKLVSIVTEKFGTESWAAARIAVMAGGIRSTTEIGEWGGSGWQIDEDVTKRMRFARLKSGSPGWWRDQIASVDEVPSRLMIALAAAAWASPKTLVAICGEMSELLDALSQSEWEMVYGTLAQAFYPVGREARSRTNAISALPKEASSRLLVLVARREDSEAGKKVTLERLAGYEGADSVLKSFIGNAAFLSLLENEKLWPKVKTTLKTRACGAEIFTHEPNAKNLSEAAAMEICEKAEEYPMFLVSLAQKKLASATGARAAKLGAVSRKNAWFEAR